MKLDPTIMRHMSNTDIRVLTAIETGMKSHSLVPAPLINSIANLRHGGTNKILSSLLRDKLLSHDQSCGYDGYRLTNCGFDILALWSLKCRGVICGLGDRIGTGKERWANNIICFNDYLIIPVIWLVLVKTCHCFNSHNLFHNNSNTWFPLSSLLCHH